LQFYRISHRNPIMSLDKRSSTKVIKLYGA
jgi:hypothetical protein